MDVAEYDKQAEKLQADLEERAPLVIWKVYREAETTVPFETVRVEACAIINGHRLARVFQVSSDPYEEVIKEIMFLTTGFFVRVMTSKDSKKWLAHWSPKEE